MVASTTKIHSPLLTRNVPDQLSPVDQYIRACAMRILGSGYSRANGGILLGKVVVNLSKKEIGIFDDNTRFLLTKVASKEELSNAMKQRFGIDVPVGTSVVSAQSSTIENKGTNDVICAVQGINHVRCKCVINPQIQNEATQSADSYVQEASFYCGYQIFIHTSKDSQENSQKNTLEAALPVSTSFMTYKSSELMNQLHGKRIEHVEIVGFGGYRPPIQSANPDIESIEKTINEIAAHFQQEFPNIVNRAHTIDPQTGVLPYESISKDCFIQKQKVETDSSFTIRPAKNPTLPKADRDTILNELAMDIRDSCENKYIKETPFSISKIFKRMSEIFPQIVSSKPRGIVPFTLVIGDSGAGKSLHIGYFLEAAIIAREEDGKFDYACPNPKLPPVGHEPTSQTRGCHMYKRYMDCAGFHDTDGAEVDICNVMAISMMNQKFSPNRLILVIPYTHLSGAKPRLLDFIKELKKIINLNDDKVISSTMFIFSDPDGLSIKTPPEVHLRKALKE